MATRTEAVNYVYDRITAGDTGEAKEAAHAILMVDQAERVHQDL